jgi:hypothetical protein
MHGVVIALRIAAISTVHPSCTFAQNLRHVLPRNNGWWCCLANKRLPVVACHAAGVWQARHHQPGQMPAA